jgi:hypothetical protein
MRSTPGSKPRGGGLSKAASTRPAGFFALMVFALIPATSTGTQVSVF